jgi:hypothetical protein
MGSGGTRVLVAAMDASALDQSSTMLRLGRRPVVSKRKGDPDGGIERVNSPRMHFDIERTAQASARAFAPLQCTCQICSQQLQQDKRRWCHVTNPHSIHQTPAQMKAICIRRM